jgi:DNA-binding transcriptional ArsR family regulator
MKYDPAEVFKILSVTSRLKILEILKTKGPIGANRIAKIIGITPAAVSQHLRVMRQAGLVSSERKGYWIPYMVDAVALERCRQILGDVCRCTPENCAREGDLENKKDNLEALGSYKQKLRKELIEIEELIKQYEEE